MPKDEEKPAASNADGSASKHLPGLWQAAVIAALAALICGYATLPGTATRVTAPAASAIARISEVAPQDVPAALETIDAPRDQLDRFRQPASCGNHLAWIVIAREPGQPTGRIRLQSGTYISPAFDLTDTPVRVALPYPAPYATGHGTISVLGSTTDASVALVPAWHVAARAQWAARTVSWTPAETCPANKN